MLAQKKRSRITYYFRKYFIIPLKILRIAIVDTVRQDGVEHAGYLAFLSILSLFPSLIFLISIVGFLGASEIGIEAIHAILASAPKEMAEGLAPRIDEIISGPPQSFLTIAIIGVIWTASSSVEGCRTILNRAYRIQSPPPYIWRRFISILEFFVIVFSIIISIFIFVIAPIFLKEFAAKFSPKLNFNYDFFYWRHVVMFVLLTCSTSILYYALPNAKQKITQTVPGSILAVFLWFSLQKLFEFYLNHFHQFNFVYGSLAGVIISLMFFYLISLIFILGAEFNYHFHRVYQVFLKPRKSS
jgi:membrane protein